MRELGRLQAQERRILREQERAESEIKDSMEVVEGLTARLRTWLSAIDYPIKTGISVDDRTYRPLLRGAPYGLLSSNGAISLAVACWHLAFLFYGVAEHTSHPGLLLLDSPFSHVGKSDTDAEFRDQRIVEGFYEQLRTLHESIAPSFQLVIVDNRPPDSANQLVTVQFTRNPADGRYGLIDDETGAPVE